MRRQNSYFELSQAHLQIIVAVHSSLASARHSKQVELTYKATPMCQQRPVDQKVILHRIAILPVMVSSGQLEMLTSAVDHQHNHRLSRREPLPSSAEKTSVEQLECAQFL